MRCGLRAYRPRLGRARPAPLPSFPRRRESERAIHSERDYAKTTPDRCAAAQTLPSMTPPDADREIPAYAGMTEEGPGMTE